MSNFPPGRWRARWIWAPRAGRLRAAGCTSLPPRVHSGVVDRMPARGLRRLPLCPVAQRSRGRERARARQPAPPAVRRRRPRAGTSHQAERVGRAGVLLRRADRVVDAGPDPHQSRVSWWVRARSAPRRPWLVTDEEWQAQVLPGWSASAATSGVSGRGDELLDRAPCPTAGTAANARATGRSRRRSRPIRWASPGGPNRRAIRSDRRSRVRSAGRNRSTSRSLKRAPGCTTRARSSWAR